METWLRKRWPYKSSEQCNTYKMALKIIFPYRKKLNTTLHNTNEV